MGKTDVDLAPRDLRLTPWTSREKGVPPSESRFTERIELLGIILLALPAIATAWAGLESAKWGRAGKQPCLRRCQPDGANSILHPGGPGDAGRYRHLHNWLNALKSDIRTGSATGLPTPALNTSPTRALCLGSVRTVPARVCTGPSRPGL